MEAQSYQKTKDKIAIGNLHTSKITLNVNGPNSQIKRQSKRFYQKTKPNHMLPSGDISKLQRQSQTQSAKLENDSVSNNIRRKAGVAILISEKSRFEDNKFNKRQRWAFYNDKGETTSRRHNTLIYEVEHPPNGIIFWTVESLQYGVTLLDQSSRNPSVSVQQLVLL